MLTSAILLSPLLLAHTGGMRHVHPHGGALVLVLLLVAGGLVAILALRAVTRER